MTNEELILEKLERLETQIQPLIKTSEKFAELKNDLIPIGNHATALLINELTEVEAGFQLENFMSLIKEAMRNTENFTFALKQMASIIEFLKDLEPLLKSAVPQMIKYLNELEQKGVFRMIQATVDLRTKVAAAYTGEDIDVMGDGIVALLGLAKSLSDPKAIALLEKLSQIPSNVELENAKSMGIFGLASAGFNPEIGKGLGVLMELTKAMGKIGPDND
ncbi:MAG: DUF1641 domain-containing protein [Desulfobacula sp.]|jgi:uncharacterized protein YjgD (DUF1641 family)|uniref:DUF1641 domain-containing protein n=1 Tax=Desulfobacula sp. TaxID=2593537 RepID=UPI001E12175A|nr:DUF1641 domain-containing protein [Desulfobacula sp.]MBT3484904.1 DUF1641 domain-containing protein [Desulfobacula sp.]MBT3803260.1 DUF1641 domain-containing protein [Desulfobacula sp.]MBT4024643.1 DUF1641 domain-containing protein [Desulfobacula sp.]MBT4200407.1 DUF1641 domain-containing protein [Desulfobacula sp.]